MNLFFEYQKKFINYLQFLQKKKLIILPRNINSLRVDLPPKGNNGDISYNAAMILSKINNKETIEFGNFIKELFLKKFKEFEKIDVASVGFLNISFKKNFWEKQLNQIIKLNKKFGYNKYKKKKYNIEFVSANPTGPLHVGHCRGAVLGDVLSNLLKFNGNSVIKEYYVNDYGEQIKHFVKSVYFRILEIKKNKYFPIDQNLYPGDYIIDIAKQIIKSKKIKDFSNFEKIYKKLCTNSLNHSIRLIKKNLKSLGIEHDFFVHETSLVNKKLVNKAISKLQKQKYAYYGMLKPPKGEVSETWKPRNQLLFNSTKFGDDTDRALQKIDGSWTYFANDIAYHSHKVDRKFNRLINVLGSDHAGYIKRITAATNAISNNKTELFCKVTQLVKLLKNGQPYKMSKRKGDYITIEDLINEVGKDSIRFMMLNRSNDVELDFDFEKVTEKSKDNPVFYVQYANARINSIFRSLNIDINKKFKIPNESFNLNLNEIEILKKISEWPKCVYVSTNKLEPHRIVYYLYDLATIFHSYWNMGKENKNLRFITNNKIKKSSLMLLKSLSIVINNGMKILGVSLPERM